MRKSAKALGQEYGLTSQEMNHLLKETGYLRGDPGNYSVTEKGATFAEERDYHRGTGGYARYNKYWTTRDWDESIVDELKVTDAMRQSARDAVAQTRRQQWDEIRTARKEADANFLANYNQNLSEEDTHSSDDSADFGAGLLIVGGLVAIGYGIYKVAPRVVNWWKGYVASKADISTKENRTKEMMCPSCGKPMTLGDRTDRWECDGCSYSISDREIMDGAIFWFCDKCGSFMNTQTGFCSEHDSWICNECGFDNDITEANIDEK